jgi:hypothetical protein
MAEQQSRQVQPSSASAKAGCAGRTAASWLQSAFVILALLAATIGTAAAAPGDLSTKYPINEDNPVAGLPTPEQREADPLEFGYLLQDLISRAEGAHTKKDWSGSVKYYEALARMVPERAIAFSRLCSGYANLGKIEIAAANCGKALRLGGARVMDHFKFVNLTLQKQNLTARDVSEVEASLAHLREHLAPKAAAEAPVSSEQSALDTLEKQAAAKDSPPTQTLVVDVAVLGCKLAVRLRDEKRIDDCLAGLESVGASPKVRLPFEWAKAIVTNDRARAAQVVVTAKSLGFPEAAIESMRAEQTRTFEAGSLFGHLGNSRWPVLFGALGLVVAVSGTLLWKFVSTKRRLPDAATET